MGPELGLQLGFRVRVRGQRGMNVNILPTLQAYCATQNG